MTFNKATKGLVHTAVTTALVLAASVSAAQTANTQLTQQQQQEQQRLEQERQRQEQERLRQEQERQRQEQERQRLEQERQQREQQQRQQQEQDRQRQQQEQERLRQEQERLRQQQQEQERQRQEQERQRQEQERQRQEQERQRQEEERRRQEQQQQQNRKGIAQGVDVPANVPVYALTSDNAIYVLRPGANNYVRLGRVETDGGNLIGMDFRVADGKLYALTDLGNLYTIPISQYAVGKAQRVSTMSPRFTGGFEMLFDFNPVANAIRVAGSNDQNLAVVNGTDGSNLTTTVAQTKFAYTTGDVNFGQDPELSGGAYTNNIAGATTTIFYAVDHDKDTLVTIADKTATGSSNTGGGKLQTIGSLVDQSGNKVNLSPTADFDIYTDKSGKNFLVGQAGRLLFSIDLAQLNPNLQVGQTQNVVVKWGPPAALPGSDAPLTGGVWDIALPIAQ